MALVKAGGIAANKRFFLALGIDFMQQMSGKLLFEYFLDLSCWLSIQLFGIFTALIYGRWSMVFGWTSRVIPFEGRC